VTAGEAALARAQTYVADSTLKAPRSGRVQHRGANDGEIVAPGGRTAVIAISDN
jgi:HlyD family secretion protein